MILGWGFEDWRWPGMQEAQGHRFETLDGMRGLCAVVIAIYHAGLFLNVAHFPPHGLLSVDMFFVLSGFVIARAYEDKLRSGMTVTAFVAARARRLLPTQLAGTLICGITALPLYWHQGPHWILALSIVLSLLLVPIHMLNMSNLPPYAQADLSVNPPLWSLQGEWIANGFYAAFLHKWSSRWLTVPIVLASVHLGYRAVIDDGSGATFVGLDRAIIGFSAGVLLFRAYRCDRLEKLPRVQPLLIYGIWLFVMGLPFVGGFPLMDFLYASAISTCLIALLVRNERKMGRLWTYLGDISYPLYASHYAMVNLMQWLWPGTKPHSLLWAIVVLAVQIAVATALERLVRMRRLGIASPLATWANP